MLAVRFEVPSIRHNVSTWERTAGNGGNATRFDPATTRSQ
jgi:hypothetical protein